ncbi:MAG: BrnT family toxin [Deltaproteobacteria bacterium]|nr:BrnT family toxin [Deltaproteobacteria bacterium]
MRFEWDPKKAAPNVRKHGVTFQEAATVFGDPLAITFDDPDHSESEERYLTFGLSLQGRLIVISHTERGDRTRIISARLMGREERVIYEQG